MVETIAIIVSCLISVMAIIVSMVVKFNDARHLEMSFSEHKQTVWKRIDEQAEKIEDLKERLSHIEGQLEGLRRDFNNGKT